VGRQRLDHLRRLGDSRQAGHTDRLREPLLHELPRVEEVRPGLEGHHHRRQARKRDRRDLVHERHSHQQILLEGHRDQLLHLGCREPEGLGLHLDRRWLVLRQQVHRGLGQLHHAQCNDADGERDDDLLKPQT
jgi:hypothetical protein